MAASFPKNLFIASSLIVSLVTPGFTEEPFPGGWTTASSREEIRPDFSFEAHGGPGKNGSLVIAHDAREGLDGYFRKEFVVAGGQSYEFEALRKTSHVKSPRRSALVRVLWQDDAGHMVSADVPAEQVKQLGHTPTAEPNHPVDGATSEHGWTTVTGRYCAPTKATRAIVELHLQWAPKGRVEWSEVVFKQCKPVPKRPVRLATIHFRPSGKSPRGNCEEYAALIADAAGQHADLVVLGETIPSVGVKSAPHEVAEAVPGPTTDYFGQIASKHRIHVVLSLYEREAHLVYNTAVLIDAQGSMIGKYRKVCLPHGEVEKGIAPGNDYPVFETTFGKVGLMVCYDGFFPEVARELANRGAEVIAWPVWGCNPLLARARACENHVYIVSSTFMDSNQNWMNSAIYDQTGEPIAIAKDWGTVAVAEVDLNQPYVGPYNLGDFHSMIPRHRPLVTSE
jgi:predicted amidohydrolase